MAHGLVIWGGKWDGWNEAFKGKNNQNNNSNQLTIQPTCHQFIIRMFIPFSMASPCSPLPSSFYLTQEPFTLHPGTLIENDRCLLQPRIRIIARPTQQPPIT